ncbi:hypothetical protein HK405_003764, partial [Cladochytrium tenue]
MDELLAQLHTLDGALTANPADPELVALRDELLALVATIEDAADAARAAHTTDAPSERLSVEPLRSHGLSSDREDDGVDQDDDASRPGLTSDAHTGTEGEPAALAVRVRGRVLLIPALVVATARAGSPTVGVVTPVPTTAGLRAGSPAAPAQVPAAALRPLAALQARLPAAAAAVAAAMAGRDIGDCGARVLARAPGAVGVFCAAVVAAGRSGRVLYSGWNWV